jgi:dihydrofolate reductase
MNPPLLRGLLLRVGNRRCPVATKLLGGMTMSLDGYVTGPNDRPGAGLGDGGERLHYWVFGGPWSYGTPPTGSAAGADRAYLDETFASGGAMIVGRTMHDVVDGWGDDPGFGMPVFVVTHRPHETVVKGNTTFEFVTDGLEAALTRATAAAGDKNVLVMGGANLLGQYLDLGVVDELVVTVAPVLLGAGKRLFDDMSRSDIVFERIGVIESPFVTHLRFRIPKHAAD